MEDPASPASVASIPPPQSPVGPHNILHLRQQQHIQQELLLQQYRQHQQQLAQAHDHQLKLHIEYLEKQTEIAAEEQRNRQRGLIEDSKIEAIKNKDIHAHSAIASSEVRQLLQDKILKKYSGAGESNNASTPIRNWVPGHIADEFPLRKTASEPNINLKLRLKQRVLDRRSSPIVKRKERIIPNTVKRRPLPYGDSTGSNPDSGQSSPPNGLPSFSSSGSTPIQEERPESPYRGDQGTATSDLNHPFSSLPNISLGKLSHSSQNEGRKLSVVSEAELVAAGPSRVSITGHILPSTLPNYPTLPAMKNEALPEMASRLKPHHLNRGSSFASPTHAHRVSGAHEHSTSRLGRSIQRPLGRTHSAPLPLGHPMLQSGSHPPTFISSSGAGSHSSTSHQYEAMKSGPLTTSSLVKQQIRQTVYKRSGSKNHVENVEEETEAALAAENLSQDSEIIDLTKKRSSGMSVIYPSAVDRIAVLQHEAKEFYSLKAPSPYSAGTTLYGPRSGSHMARPLSRALSSPLVSVASPPPEVAFNQNATGLAYDTVMERHGCLCSMVEFHPENGTRIHSIWKRLEGAGLLSICPKISTRKASLEEIQSCHSEAHTLFFGTNPMMRQSLDFLKMKELPIKHLVKMMCGGLGVDTDTTWHEIYTSEAAKIAVGCVVDLSFKVARGELRNGYAIVRPPGHHAEYEQAMGFCFFNSIAIAARQLQYKLGLKKILIVDWDVHHGNGTQSTFFDDSQVLYISIHRYDDGAFFPGTGAPSEVGEGQGFGYNVNIPWCGNVNPPMGDAEYLAAFRSIVVPIAQSYDADIILVSAGFDAACGHAPTLGGYNVTPGCFAHMTSQLMSLARGKVVLVLEGGYEIEPICDASEACVRTLLGEAPASIAKTELERRPNNNAIETLTNVLNVQTEYWPVLRANESRVYLSDIETKLKEEEQQATVNAMASLNMDHQLSVDNITSPEMLEPEIEVTLDDEEEPMDQEIAE